MSPGVPRFPWLKLAAACVVLGLHAGVLAMVLSSPVVAVAPGRPDALDVQFVELAPAMSGEAAAAAGAEAATATTPEPEAEPTPAPEPEPAPEAEPLKAQPRPVPVKKHAAPAKHRQRRVSRPSLQPAAEASAAAAGSRSAGRVPTQLAAAGSPAPSADADRPRVVGQVDYLGKRPTPVYPPLSERRGEQGRVVLRVLISPQGRVSDVTVRRSSGYHRLDEAAVDAMRQACFKPYTENGIAYKALVDIPFDFVL